MKDIQCCCPLELTLMLHVFVKHAAEVEHLVHAHFENHRLTLGGKLTEWFKLTQEEVQHILQVIPEGQLLPGQQLEQDYRKGAVVGERNTIYLPASSWCPGAGLVISRES